MKYVLLAHGSSDARHAAEARALAQSVSETLGEEVGCAFLSDDSLPQGARVLPLFLGHGVHLRRDVPALAARSNAELLPALADRADAIAEVAFARMTAETRRVNALFGMYRFAGFEQLYAALHERIHRCTRVARAALHAEPSIASVLRLWREEEVGPIRLQPMLLFSGRSYDEMAEQAAGEDVDMMPPLAHGEDMARLISEWMREG